ncbi:MAG: restriction endonuclease [Proteobacteria bacterium]|nr:restriction endonuclease [Pseudomonadota bacterium]
MSGAIVVVAIVVLLAMISAAIVLSNRRKAAQRRHARDVFWQIAEEHQEALGRQYLKLSKFNAYGIQDFTAWTKELNEFYSTVLIPQMYSRGVQPLLVGPTAQFFKGELEQFAKNKADDFTAGLSFNPKMSPLEFEQFCAGILKNSGWKTQLTPGSGDQGADIIAYRGNDSLVVQCKLYTTPVGNKAVQEAHTAKVHVGVNRAVVVSNKDFTPKAQELAATTGTELVHYTQLKDL